MHPGDVIEPQIAWMIQMNLTALPLASQMSSIVLTEGSASRVAGCVMMILTVMMVQTNSIALGEYAQPIR